MFQNELQIYFKMKRLENNHIEIGHQKRLFIG